MNNTELITELRSHIREVPLTLLRDAADALEADEKRIAELSLDCELFQQKCMELELTMQTTVLLKPNEKRPLHECAVCGWYFSEGDVKDFSYCPNCGARMRGERDE